MDSPSPGLLTTDPGHRGKGPNIRALAPNDGLHSHEPWSESGPQAGAERTRENRRLQNKVQAQAGPVRNQAIPGTGLLPDSEIVSRWRKLNWELGQIVSNNVVEPSLSYSPTKYTTGFLRRIVQEPNVFLGSKGDRMDLVQAIIWDHLAEYVFASRSGPSRGYWAGERYEKFHELNRSIVGSLQYGDSHFHLWRSQSAALLSSYASLDSVKRNAHACVDRILKDLKLPFRTWGPTLDQQLLNLVLEAIQLDSDLAQQRASWFCEYPGDRRHEMEFDDFAMKPVNHNFEEGETRVALIVAPALMKAGDSTGDHYDSEQLMVESLVYRGRPFAPDKQSPLAAPLGYRDLKRAARVSQSKPTGKKSFFNRG
ncbi:uncharacterized protein PG986_005561 [Apiospora aurea]|uniref:Uncharacterized protein n=1 Tax=Apiospora aurea TaxID=335848 RepID=A0ABR1QIA3_9PEZI